MTDAADDIPAGASSPARFWWLKRIAAAYAVGAIALAAAVAVWARGGERARDALVARWQAEGAPTSSSAANAELDARSTPESRDAGARLIAAASDLRPADRWRRVIAAAPGSTGDDYWRWRRERADRRRRPPSSEDLVWIRAEAESYGGAIATFDALLDGRPIDWGQRYAAVPAYAGAAQREAFGQADVLRALADAAILAHVDGDDALAVRRIAAIVALSDALCRPPVPSDAHNVGAAMLRDAVPAALVPIVATLRIDAPGGARRADVEGLITRLLDDDSRRSAFVAALKFQRFAHPFATYERPSPTAPPIAPWLYRSAARYGYARSASWADVAIDAADEPSFSASQRLLDARVATARGDWFVARRWQLARVPATVARLKRESPTGVSESPIVWHTALRSRRVAATLLAIRLFELDAGRGPASMEELVPRYLPAVPIDTATGREAMAMTLVVDGGLIAITPGVTRRPPGGWQWPSFLAIYRGQDLVAP